jgi:ADP-ribosylglycohydrolase
MKTLDALMGLCVGDALGVPAEFQSRQSLKNMPVRDMVGFGSHNQPEGTWSDDSSLAFCLAESLCDGYDIGAIAKKFVAWYRAEVWTPHGRVFDIGIATSKALHRVAQGTNPLLSGGATEQDNGNGSLMRILPLIFYLVGKPIEQRFQIVSEVSSITHAHIRSILACFIYCEYALLLLAGKDKMEAYLQMQHIVLDFLAEFPFAPQTEIDKFHRVLGKAVSIYEFTPIHLCQEDEISSSGYVLSTLEASFWAFLTTTNYHDAVLKAINLGEDTDTTGCVTGGLAGLYYGVEAIPLTWRNRIVKKEEIETLAKKIAEIN